MRSGTASMRPAAATIAGDGVSPAASAAASGSPPGSAADTAIALAGRSVASRERQRWITRSTAGSSSRPALRDTWTPSSCMRSSSAIVVASKARLPV